MTAPMEIKAGRLVRDLHQAEITVHQRTAQSEPLRMSFPASSETPVERLFGTEILRHDERSIRMDRLKTGAAPLLFNHNWNDPIGMVDNARDLVKLLPAMNLTNDPELSAIGREIRDMLVSADQLRVNAVTRKRVAETADAILRKIQ